MECTPRRRRGPGRGTGTRSASPSLSKTARGARGHPPRDAFAARQRRRAILQGEPTDRILARTNCCSECYRRTRGCQRRPTAAGRAQAARRRWGRRGISPPSIDGLEEGLYVERRRERPRRSVDKPRSRRLPSLRLSILRRPVRGCRDIHRGDRNQAGSWTIRSRSAPPAVKIRPSEGSRVTDRVARATDEDARGQD